MPQLSAGDVATICGGRLIGDPGSVADRFVHDSRSVEVGTAFAAIGPGNAFVRDAFASGASFAVVESDEAAGNDTVVVVEDTTAALTVLATAVRAKMSLRVVGITGSTGKTLTKDLVAAVLASRYKVHASPKSFNQEVGVPLVVLGCPSDADVMVAELGARHAGEIAALAQIVQPHVGIITGIGITHLEEFGSRGAIARTKSELLAALPADGVAIVPSNDDYLALLSAATSARMCTVGPGASVSYRAERVDANGNTFGSVSVDGRDVAVTLPVAGRALLRNAAFAIAAGVEHGIDPGVGASRLAEASLSSFRMEMVDVEDWTIVNDAYNANPTSVASALRSVKEMAGDRVVWAVLGPMTELGPVSAPEHVRMGRLAADLGYDGVIALGEEGAGIARGAGSIAVRVASAQEAADTLGRSVPRGAVVLVKASRVVSLEHFPDILKARGDHAGMRREGAASDGKA